MNIPGEPPQGDSSMGTCSHLPGRSLAQVHFTSLYPLNPLKAPAGLVWVVPVFTDEDCPRSITPAPKEDTNPEAWSKRTMYKRGAPSRCWALRCWCPGQRDLTWAVRHRTRSAEGWDGETSLKPAQQVDISGRCPLPRLACSPHRCQHFPKLLRLSI